MKADMSGLAKIAIVAAVGAGAGMGVVSAGDSRARAAAEPADLQAYTARALQEHFPNVPLVTQDKKTVHFYDDLIKGRVAIIQFMFTNCEQYCPMVTPNLVKVQTELSLRAAKEVTMISITVDPVHDTPDVLKEYSNKFHVRPGWHFLTGSKTDIDRIRRELGVYDSDDKKTEHMNVLTIGRESTGQWLAIEALAKPDDIVQTVLALSARPARRVAGKGSFRK